MGRFIANLLISNPPSGTLMRYLWGLLRRGAYKDDQNKTLWRMPPLGSAALWCANGGTGPPASAHTKPFSRGETTKIGKPAQLTLRSIAA